MVGKEEVLADICELAGGKYKVRVIRDTGKDRRVALDIREYVDRPGFKGFTRRGVRLFHPKDGMVLAHACQTFMALVADAKEEKEVTKE